MLTAVERELVHEQPGLRIERGAVGDRPALFVELVRRSRVVRLDGGTPGALEVLDHRFDGERDSYAIENLPGGELLETLLRRHGEILRRWRGAVCHGCGAALEPRVLEAGLQLLCFGCGAMFDTAAVDPPEPDVAPRADADLLAGEPFPLDVALAIGLAAIDLARAGWSAGHDHRQWSAALGLMVHLDAAGRCRWAGLDLVGSLYDDDIDQLTSVISLYRYLSPEGVAGAPLDTPAFTFTTAALLYELVTGRHPVAPWDAMFEMLTRIRDIDIAPGNDRLGALLAGALARDPDRRPPLGDFETQLRAIADELDVDASAAAIARHRRGLGAPPEAYERWPTRLV